MAADLFKKGHRDLPGMVCLGASMKEAETLFLEALRDRLLELDEIERLGIDLPPYAAQVRTAMRKLQGAG